MPILPTQNLIEAAKFRIKYKDIFSIKEYYDAMHEWFIEQEWVSVDSEGNPESGLHKDNWETNYIERIFANGAKEMYWWWRLQKIPANSYYKYHLDLDFHPLGITDTEVMREGKKFKVNKGEVEVWVYAYLEFDVGGKWSKHWFLKFFNKIFPNRIFRKDLYEDHKLELYREAYTLQTFMKRWFKLKRYLPYEERALFFPSQAYPTWTKEE